MGFSATASFIAGTSVAGIGMATLSQTKAGSEVPFAMSPLLFGVQQLIEGVIWLTSTRDAPVLRQAISYVYSGFAHVLWPIYVPFALYWLEPVRWRRMALASFQVVGLAVVLPLLYYIVTRPVIAQLAGSISSMCNRTSVCSPVRSFGTWWRPVSPPYSRVTSSSMCLACSC